MPSVASTVLELLSTCTVSVSNAVVVVVSAVSMCSQNVSVAVVTVDAMVTVWVAVSVWRTPYPSSHASQAPVCAGSAVELFSTPAVSVHGVAVPVSNPPLTIRFCAEAELIVNETVVVWVSAPETPVIVMVLVPTVAVLVAVNVKTLVEAVGLVPNVAVTPLGKAELESVTAPVKPPTSVTEIVLLPLVPCLTVKLAGEAESEKSGCAGALMVRDTVVVWVSVPEVPVIVTVEVPVVAVELAVKVTALVEVVGLVPNVAVTPEGKAEVDKVTLPVNPPAGWTVTVLLPLVPCVTVTLLGESVSEKSGFVCAGGSTQLFAELENSS